MKVPKVRADANDLGIAAHQESALQDDMIVPFRTFEAHAVKELLANVIDRVVGTTDSRPAFCGTAGGSKLFGEKQKSLGQHASENVVDEADESLFGGGRLAQPCIL